MSERITQENVGQVQANAPVMAAPAQAEPAQNAAPATPAPATPAPATPAPAALEKKEAEKPKATEKQSLTELMSLLQQMQEQLLAQQKTIDAMHNTPGGAGFLKSGVTPTDEQRHLTKMERTKKWIWAQPMMPVFIPLEGGEKLGEASIPVTRNGYRVNVPKGVYIDVPKPIADVIKDHLNQSNAALESRFRLDVATPDKLEALSH